jgi:hypothetical protein
MKNYLRNLLFLAQDLIFIDRKCELNLFLG